jgi:hypothetical protein
MTYSNEDVKSWIISVLDKNLSERDLARLIHYCAAHATSILRRNFRSRLPMFHNAGYSDNDLAVRCIEDLFLPRGNSMCHDLRRFFVNLGEEIPDRPPADFIMELRRLIYGSIHKTLPEIAGDIDPHYRKILRNVREAIRADNRMLIRDHFNDRLVSRGETNGSAAQKEEMPADELLNRLSTTAAFDDPPSVLVEHIFSIVENQADYRSALSINTITQVIRDFYLIYRFDDETDLEPDHIEGFEIDELSRRTIDRIRKTLFADYERRNVCGPEEIRLLENAVRSILADLSQKHARRFFDYFQEQFPGVSYEEYRAKARARFEYLMQSARDHFFKLFRAHFS